MKSIEDDLLKTAAKEAKGLTKAATILSKSYKDKDEKSLRDKLVNKLKEKEVNRMKHLDVKMKKILGEKIDDEDDSNEEEDDILGSMEEISDEEIEVRITILRKILNF